MSGWRFAVGNLITRAGSFGVASGATEDPLYPLSKLGNGYPDEAARFLLETDGVYAVTFDLNLLRLTTDRADAPIGWADLINANSGTPGQFTSPPDRATYFARTNVVRFFRSVYQDIDVMPGENLEIDFALYRDDAGGSSVTKLGIKVLDLKSGCYYDGAANVWTTDPTKSVGETTMVDTWVDITESIPADPTQKERTIYRVILFNEAPSFDANSDAYVHDPALYAELDFVAGIGHNLPKGSTITFNAIAAVSVAQPSFSMQGAPATARNWTLTITYPTGAYPYADRPIIGELWASMLREDMPCPVFPFDLVVEDVGQVRLPGGRGRLAVWSDSVRPNRTARMKFKDGQIAYEQSRNNILGATRNGADPMLLVPVDGFEAIPDVIVIFHGRVGEKTTYSRTGTNARNYEIELEESPFPRGLP